MTRVSISPEVLDWVVERSGKTDQELSAQYPRWDAWLSGNVNPTLKRAQKLARLQSMSS